jgi:choline dehydrogenase-like flavoprotein
MQIFYVTLLVSQVVSGNPVAVINMIGERAADFIKDDDDNEYDLKGIR